MGLGVCIQNYGPPTNDDKSVWNSGKTRQAKQVCWEETPESLISLRDNFHIIFYCIFPFLWTEYLHKYYM